MTRTRTVAAGFCGRLWQEELALGEQHGAFMGDLVRTGVLELAGDLVGLLFAEDEPDAARAALEDDPASRAGLIRWQVYRWHL